MSNLIDFREYIEEQKKLSFGVELGGTPAVVGSVAREYDFILESIDVYLDQEHEKHQLNENQQKVLKFLIEQCEPEGNLYLAVESLCDLMWDNQLGFEYEEVREANFRLSRKQHAEVLQAFAEWGLGHERN